MRFLVTAGSTKAPIDAVRCITNVFTGRTGAAIAVRAGRRGHDVTLLTSNVQTAFADRPPPHVVVKAYSDFDDLRDFMRTHIRGGTYDVVVHSAAVSDYLVQSVHQTPLGPPFEASVGKIKSDSPELWLRLVRAPKLIDAVRSEWGFTGTLVKFKLEVGVDDDRLLDIAEHSRLRSGADLMVANALERYDKWAWIGPVPGHYYERVARAELADRLLDAIDTVREAR